MKIIFYFILVLATNSCTSTDENSRVFPVAVGLDGRKFYEPIRSSNQQRILDSNLMVAKEKFLKDRSEENYIWYGRREGYLLHLQKSIDIYSEGIKKYPNSFRLLRHRGHRYISIRAFDKAIDDLKRATELMKDAPSEIEPDGIPNKLNSPVSTTQFNVWYHLGLAYYLKQDYTNAAIAYEKCLSISNNDDLFVATADWLYMTYRRLNKIAEANELLSRLNREFDIIENDAYYKRLLLYKGDFNPDSLITVNKAAENYDLMIATQGYGVANWYLRQKDTLRAVDLLNKVLNGNSFSSFGFIAAEADLLQLKK